MTVSHYLQSLIRTLVPFIVGFIVQLGVPDEFIADIEGLVALVVSAIYYATVRWLEQSWPVAGWFLGYRGEPNYE